MTNLRFGNIIVRHKTAVGHHKSSEARLPKTNLIYADMAELADALDSGSSEGNFMQVRFLLSAPTKNGCFYKATVFLYNENHAIVAWFKIG